MKQQQRINFTAAEKAEIWERWRRGEPLRSIARDLGRYSAVVRRFLAGTGGISPPPRRRSERALTLVEREEISRGVAAQCSLRSIARQLGRSPSTISRELSRNGGRECYRASRAEDAAWRRARRPKACKLVQHPELQSMVAEKLRCHWSPEQIAGWLRRSYPDSECLQVSHETIYRSLFVQARGALKKELLAYLRSQRTIRRSRHARPRAHGQGKLKDIVSIWERPAEVADRAVPGHWEGDLICGSHSSQIATLVERHSRYVMLVKVPSKDTETVVEALRQQAQRLPRELYKSLTWDRGKEMAAHQRFTLATDISVYFCDPQSPWQRGSNENTNRLLRQYYPKGIDLSIYSQEQLDAVAREMNERPRKTLGYETPAERFDACVASTG